MIEVQQLMRIDLPLPRSTLFVSDLHLGARRFEGQDEDTLQRLGSILDRIHTEFDVYILGDLFHHYDPPVSLLAKFLNFVQDRRLSVKIILGNHEFNSRRESPVRECLVALGLLTREEGDLTVVGWDDLSSTRQSRYLVTHGLPEELSGARAKLVIAGGYHHPEQHGNVVFTGALTKTSVSDGRCSCLFYHEFSRTLNRFLLDSPELTPRKVKRTEPSTQPPEPHRTTLTEYVKEVLSAQHAEALQRVAPEADSVTLWRFRRR